MASKVINLTTNKSDSKSSKRSKSASPTLGKSGSSTSIIDNILKDRSATSANNSSPGKKLIIDLAKDNFILTDAKPSKNDNSSLLKPQPIKPLVSKPIDRVIIDVPQSADMDKLDLDDDIPSTTTATKKTARKSPSPIAAGSLGNPTVSREKMDKMKALDAVFLSSTPSPIPDETRRQSPVIHGHQNRAKSADPLDFIFNDAPPAQIPTTSAKLLPIPSPRQSPTQQPTLQQQNQIHTNKPSDIKIIKSGGANSPSIATTSQGPVSHDLTRQKLDSVNRNIAKIQSKINEKGAKEKYAVMLKDLEKQKQKYETRLAAELKSGQNSPQPAYPPPTYNQSIVGTNTSTTAHQTAHQTQQNSSPRTSPTPGKPKSPQPTINSPRTTTELAKEEQIATDRELARIRELFPDTHKSGTGKHTQNQRPKEVQSLFNVSNNLDTLREKQKHLEQQHKKMEEQYAHKLKQIERMRTQKEEITKLSALEIERRKIYEMEQKLKRLDKEQWEEQQRLRKELQTINLGNLHAISRNNNMDVGEFYALKQSLSPGRTTSISPVSAKPNQLSDTDKFRLVDWFAGFMATSQPTNKKYNPENFKEVVLGQQPLVGDKQQPLVVDKQQPLVGDKHKTNEKTQNPIAGYHYYNTELPSTAWIEEQHASTNNDADPNSWQDYQLGYGQMAQKIIDSISVSLKSNLEEQKPTDDKPVLELINELGQLLGCQNISLMAKGLDFVVDKLNSRSGTKNQRLLNLLVELLTQISSRITILDII